MSGERLSVALYTLGCKVNQYDTQTMQALFEADGFDVVDFDSPADVYVVNTCTVTAMSDKKSRQMIARAHRKNPCAPIVVAGCYAQHDSAAVLALPGVKVALGTSGKGRVVELAKRALYEGIAIDAALPEIDREYEALTPTPIGKTRAHLKVQDGCDRFCSYCIIPYVRGRVRSLPHDKALEQAAMLTGQGFCEIVLTGIHLASYSDGEKTLADVIRDLCKLPDLARLRLGSLEPVVLTDEFLTTLAENPKVCRQLHLSLQSGSTSVLKRMNRRYTAEQYAKSVERLREFLPDCAITTDIIAGFPGETPQEHQETLDFVRKIGFSHIHVFPYSPREGTPAAKNPDQIPPNVKHERAGELIALGLETQRAYIARFVGRTMPVLFEDDGEGYTDNYIRVKVSEEVPSGEIVDVLLERPEAVGEDAVIHGSLQR